MAARRCQIGELGRDPRQREVPQFTDKCGCDNCVFEGGAKFEFCYTRTESGLPEHSGHLRITKLALNVCFV